MNSMVSVIDINPLMIRESISCELLSSNSFDARPMTPTVGAININMLESIKIQLEWCIEENDNKKRSS